MNSLIFIIFLSTVQQEIFIEFSFYYLKSNKLHLFGYLIKKYLFRFQIHELNRHAEENSLQKTRNTCFVFRNAVLNKCGSLDENIFRV